MTDLRALAWKWGDGCASAHLDDDGNVVIDKWNPAAASRKTKPSRAEVDAAVTEFVSKEVPRRVVGERRAAAYPPHGDQLDAIWKAFNQMRLDGSPLPQEVDDMLGKVLAVKRDNPMPEDV